MCLFELKLYIPLYNFSVMLGPALVQRKEVWWLRLCACLWDPSQSLAIVSSLDNWVVPLTTVLCLEVHLGMAGDFIWLWLSVGCETISFFHRSGMVRLFFC